MSSAEELTELVKNRDTGDNTLQRKYGGGEGVLKKLGTNPQSGLKSGEVQQKKEAFGENVLPQKPPTPFWRFLLDALKDKTLIILTISSIVSIILGLTMPPPGESRETGWIEGTAILVAVIVVSTVTATNDWSKDKKFRKLSAASEDRKIKVLREGKSRVISVFELVVGDIVLLETGDYIPADMLYLSGQGLVVDESSMTGEPEGIRKSEDEDPWLLGGTMVTDGQAKGIVIAVGPNTQWGKIKADLQKEEVKTPLQVKLENLAESIGKLGLGAAILTFLALVLKWSITKFAINKEPWEWSELGIIVNYIITAITIIVVAVPEGLPLAVTLSLAYSMMRMMKDQNLVRHLAACETMGGATNICSDKTGTLTQNIMTVVKVQINGETLEKFSEEDSGKISDDLKELLTEAVCLNSTAYFTKDDNSDKTLCMGPKTEGALLTMAQQLGVDYEELRNKFKIEKVFPFSSKKKRMSTIVTTQSRRVYVKGASEVILELCNDVLGNKNENWKQEYSKLIEQWASEGLRTLTIAYRELSDSEFVVSSKSKGKESRRSGPKDQGSDDEDTDLDNNLTLIAIVAIEDPLRPEVAESVTECQNAGITVRMLTGDNILTAKKIAKNCGILKGDGVAIEGPKWRNLSQEEMDELIPNLQVIARCSPDDKLLLVKRLRQLGEVVAVTGDGTNDAPALSESDIGLAMGIAGTEVAKENADVIIMDDNFSTIVNVARWGRAVYLNIQKFVQFQLTVNIVALIVNFISACIIGTAPLTAVQLLWVNMIMDTLGALALATEPPNDEMMNRPPVRRGHGFITQVMWRNIIGQALYQLLVLGTLMFNGKRILNIEGPNADRTINTLIFNSFVFCQVFNEINSREMEKINVFRGILKNWVFISILTTTIIFQVIIVEFLGTFANTVPLSWELWLLSAVLGSVSLVISVILKCIPVESRKTDIKPHGYELIPEAPETV